MAQRPVPFQFNEWFHCYNRGIEKRVVFESEDNSERFLQILYLANSTNTLHRSNLSQKTTEEVVSMRRSGALVSIGAYCLMPNHFHLLLKEITDGGITRFMQKLGTAYTMYFNKKNARTGNLFMKPFRSRHVGEDRYFQHVVNYIHCNPAERFDGGWKKGAVRDMDRLEKQLLTYRYSSFPDFAGDKRPISAILSPDVFDVYRHSVPRKILDDARAYYASIAIDDPNFVEGA
ncbi:MAG: transposase [Patescibacteria group bacterium]